MFSILVSYTRLNKILSVKSYNQVVKNHTKND